MPKQDFRSFLQELGMFIVAEMNFILENFKPHGVKNSDLQKSFNYKLNQTRNGKGQFSGFVQGSGIEILANYYADYLDRGRKPRARKIPINILITWVKKKKLQFRNKKNGKFISQNSTAFIIQNSIYKKGIKGRNFIQPAITAGEQKMELYLDNDVLDILTEDLDKQFE